MALTERDLDLLTLVGLCRYVSVVQIAREFFPSMDRARRRIRCLFDAGYLSVALVTSTAPNVVALARRGLDVLRIRPVDPIFRAEPGAGSLSRWQIDPVLVRSSGPRHPAARDGARRRARRWRRRFAKAG